MEKLKQDGNNFHLTKQPLYDKESLHYGWERQFYIEYERYEKHNNKNRKIA